MKQLSRRTVLRGMGADHRAAVSRRDVSGICVAQAVKKSLAANRMAFLYVPNGIIDGRVDPGRSGHRRRRRSAICRASPRPGAVPQRHHDADGTHLRWRARARRRRRRPCARRCGLPDVRPSRRRPTARTSRPASRWTRSRPGSSKAQTRFASLELGCEEGIQGGNCDNGYSCAYSNSMSWRTENTPNPPEIRPRAVFERLFGSGDDEKDPGAPAAAGQLPQEHSRYRAGRCAEPQERRSAATIAASSTNICTPCATSRSGFRSAEREQHRRASPVDAPSASVPHDFAEHSRLMFDLHGAGVPDRHDARHHGDAGIEQSPRNYPEIGITEGHHGLTHHQRRQGEDREGDADQRVPHEAVHLLARQAQVDPRRRRHAARQLDDRVRQRRSPTAISISITICRPSWPAAAAARCIRAGTCATPDETPMANLFLSMLDRMGVPADKWGDSTGRLEGLSDL